LQIGEGLALRDEEGEKRAEVPMFHGNAKEAEVEVLVIVGAEAVVKVQRGKMMLLSVRETKIKKEKDTTMSDYVNRERMKEKKDIRDRHYVSVTTKVKKYYYSLNK